MAFWNRRAATNGRSPAQVILPTFDGVTAAAQPFDITNQADRAKLAKLQQQWHTDAWLYLDRVGELKDAYRFVENSFRRLRIYAAFEREPDDDPIPVTDAVEAPDGAVDVETEDLLPADVAELADGIAHDFAARDGGQGSLLARLGVNIFMVGEALVIQRAVPERRPFDGEDPSSVPRVWDWEVRSLHEVREGRSGRGMETFDEPDQQQGVPIEGLGDTPPFVERIWRKSGQWSGWSDSNVKAAVDILEEVRLLSLVARASLRSRAMAGFFRVPEELDFGGTDLPGGAPGPTTQGVTFERAMAEAFAAAIGNEADPNSVAPILVRGKSEFLNSDVFGPIEMPRRYGEDERAQYEAAIRKLARTIELPMEALTGAEGLSHWSLWSVDSEKYRAYIEPLANVAVEGLTYGLLRARLRDEGVDQRWVDRISFAVDASDLVRRADEGKVAEAMHERGAISDETLRRANGFGDGDAPPDEELLRRWLLRSQVPPELVIDLLRRAELTDGMPPMVALTPGGPDGEEPEPEPDATDPDKGPPPEGDREPAPPPEANAALVAAAAERDVGRALASIDALLLERLLVAADQAVTRVLERVGARIRSRPKSSQPAALRSALLAAKEVANGQLVRHLDPALVLAAVGAEPVAEDDDDFVVLGARFGAWVLAAQDGAGRELAAAAGDSLSESTLRRLRDEQRSDREDGWAVLLAALVAYTLGLINRTEEAFDADGEWDPTITVRASLVREALAVAGGNAVERSTRGGVIAPGGGPLGGVATGSTLQRAAASANIIFGGWTWEYGAAPRKQPYEPHLALDGATSDRWGASSPGDHGGCLCGMVPTVLTNPVPATQAA